MLYFFIIILISQFDSRIIIRDLNQSNDAQLECIYPQPYELQMLLELFCLGEFEGGVDSKWLSPISPKTALLRQLQSP